MITVDLRNRTPLYEQIKSNIRELILLDVLKPNEQLPSIRVLSKELNINVNTVKKAYQELENEGIIYYLSGRGSFICENALRNEATKHKAIHDIRAAIYNARIMGVNQDEIMKIVREVFINDQSRQL